MSLNSRLGSENRGFVLAAVAVLAIVFAVLLIRPQGLLGTRLRDDAVTA